MAENHSTIASVRETGESAYAVQIDVSGHRLLGDEPLASGGGNMGPAPYDLLTAALAECTAMTIRWYAIQKNWPLERVEVEVSYGKIINADGTGKADEFVKKIAIYGDQLTAEQRAKLHEISAKCPVQRTLEGTPKIVTA